VIRLLCGGFGWLIWCGLCWVWLRVTGRGAVVVDEGWQQ